MFIKMIATRIPIKKTKSLTQKSSSPSLSLFNIIEITPNTNASAKATPDIRNIYTSLTKFIIKNKNKAGK